MTIAENPLSTLTTSALNTRIAIPGLGGLGGTHAATLAQTVLRREFR